MVRSTLCAMAGMVKRREVSPAELLRAHLEQIARVNPRVNAFIEVYEEGIGGGVEGVLAGVPVTIKDSFDIAGRVTNCGSLLRRDAVAREDSTAVARLKAAGAVIIGKTSTPEFLYNYVTDNRIIGRTNHPLDETRTPGGSSGGEAAAISSFMSAGGIGSDGGGSIREPAHFCGICGLKPTPGRVPAFGHWPEIANPTGFMGVGGPMARTAADVRLLFSVLAGHDARDPFSVPVELRAMPSVGVRVAVMSGRRVQRACAGAAERAVALLAAMGHECEEFSAARIEGAHELWRSLFVDYLTPGILAMIAGREDECSWTSQQLTRMMRGTVDVGRLGEVLLRRDRMRGELLHWMGARTVIVAPAFGTTAFHHGQNRFAVEGGEIGLMEAIEVVSPWNLLGMPAMVVPMGVDDDGMPAGVQLIGAPWCEELVLDLAVRLEEARGTEWDNTTFSRTSTSSTISPMG